MYNPSLARTRRTGPVTLGLLVLAGCGGSTSSSGPAAPAPARPQSTSAPSPDPRVGLRPGLMNAGEAIWNLRLVSTTPPPERFRGVTNSDLAFLGNYAIQGNYNGWQIWDISNPAKPALATAYVCPASQSDVSVYRNLLFISGEGLSGRLDCGTQGVRDTVSQDRLRGVRIFDITDIRNPKNVGNVQTCRGSHTHSLLVDPKDPANVYVYISGSAPPRSPNEMAGCIAEPRDPNSALFRIEVIKVPLANPSQAAIVSSPRIFQNLAPPLRHAEAPEDIAAAKRQAEAARARGEFTVEIFGTEQVLPPQFSRQLLDSLVRVRGGSGAPTSADSATLRRELPGIVQKLIGADGPRTGPTQCHDITLYPEIGMAGGACEGYGFLLDISDPANPRRIAEVADSNFSYWHSATFNNDGSKILFSDEWGGGSQAKCRVTDKKEWGADALFTIVDDRGQPIIYIDGIRTSGTPRSMKFESYFKMPAAQTPQENCVAHNGSQIPIPGRDIMVQAWYQGGISVFDWTDIKNPVEIAYHDRGPSDSTRIGNAGSWSVYWYNGLMVSSEIGRGLDIFELVPSGFISQNEIDAAKTVKFDYFNTQGQRKFVWPASFALARAYLDQLERSGGLSNTRISAARTALSGAEQASGSARSQALTQLAGQIEADAGGSRDGAKVRALASAVRNLSSAR